MGRGDSVKNRKLERKVKDAQERAPVQSCMLEEDSIGLDPEAQHALFTYSLTDAVYPVYHLVFF